MIKTFKIGKTVEVETLGKSIYGVSKKERAVLLNKISNAINEDMKKNQDREYESALYAAEFRTKASF